ncbi:MAG: pyridoxal 5'-phosphate synthase glutaminase subunit PdxT [Dehalococcoidia bacterium]|nr:pyridoxal 5'-phosphate synthase glutaminase subunit PdxT [Dehalococcoidia bacterium]
MPSAATPPTSESGAPSLRVGVLALQGDFAEHLAMLRRQGVEAVEVRTLDQLEACDGLIIPGGESTTIARLLAAFDLTEPLRDRIRAGLPTWGTCAGAILLADDVPGLDREPLGVMDMTVERNAFGRQVQSFEANLDIDGLDAPLRAVFIRAPVFTRLGRGVRALATLPDGRIVAAGQGHLLATSFHPELTEDDRLHGLFVALCREYASVSSQARAS